MNQERLMNVILAPIVSEKSTRTADKYKQFCFEVLKDASKPEVKQAVELLFNVKVDAVRIMNVRGKKRTFAGIRGQRSNWKKAFVTLHEGHDINFAGVEV